MFKKKTLFVLLSLFFLFFLFIFLFIYFSSNEKMIYVPVKSDKKIVLNNEVKRNQEDKEKLVEKEKIAEQELEGKEFNENDAVVLAPKLNLDVDFSTQAPTLDWGMPYQEACEEASLIMVYHYFAQKPLNRSIMNEELLKLVDWEKERFGYYEDTNLAEVQIIAKEYFNLDTEITNDVSIENIKYQLNKGYLIIMPFAGRLLENPYFSGEGPLFHMLVIRGYDSKNIITNDPGLLTKGENFKYSYENIEESVHDWNGGDVYNGPRLMLIVKGFLSDN